MPDLYAEIQVNSLAAPLDAFTLSMDQSRGHTGAPNSVVRFRPIKVTITGLAAILAFFTEWAVDSYLRRSGRIVVYEGDRVKWVLSFYDARCMFYYTRFQPGETEHAAYQLTLEIAACAWEMDGLQIEIYSRIPWVKNFKTRWAALTPPADILPPPSLRNLPAEREPTSSQDPTPSPQLRAQVSTPSTQTSTASKANSYRKASNKPTTNNPGRTGKQARLRELAEDDKLGTADRGWLNQEINAIKRKSKRKGRDGNLRPQTNIRNPPGKDLAHRRGERASQGFSYKTAVLQDVDLHRLEHKHEGYK